MRRLMLYLMTGMCVASATAQNVTYNHDSAKQNQFTVAEIGSSTLTPDLYYTLLHNSYRKTASAKNKLSFRTTAGIAGYWQVDDAEKLDSAMTKRAEIEALNVADRTGGALDVAWLAEGDKLNSKMADFKKNIDRILQLGGSPASRRCGRNTTMCSSRPSKRHRKRICPTRSARSSTWASMPTCRARTRNWYAISSIWPTARRPPRCWHRAMKGKQKRRVCGGGTARWRDACWSATGNSVNQP